MGQKLTGRFGSATVDSIAIDITKWSAKLKKEQADSTDSGNYDATTQQTWKSQQPGVVSVEATIEGNFDLSTTSPRIIQKLKSDAVLPVVLKITPSVTFCSGNFDFDEVEVNLEVPGSTMVTFSATVKSNGVVTLS